MRYIMRLSLMTGVLLMAWAVGVVSAQNGQICVRSFDDRNANATYDAGEPLITRGITANLLDADNVIISTRLLEDSAQATQGLMCFQQLEAGQYTIQVASADYNATTTDAFVTAVTETSIPQVFDFGAQVVVLDPASLDAPLAEETDMRAVLAQVLFAGLGALITMGGMVVLGTLIYFLFLRAKPAPAPIYATGAYPAVPQAPPPQRATREQPAIKADTGGYASAGGYVSSATAAPQAPVPQAPVPQTPAPQAPAPQAPAPQTPAPQAPVSGTGGDWDDLPSAPGSPSTPPSTPPVTTTTDAPSQDALPPRREDDSDAMFRPPSSGG